MEKVHGSILELIGGTPLVRIGGLNTGGAEIIAKVEYFNPGSSVKDRVALAMIEDAERRGVLRPGGIIIEPTSGNTGIGLALVAALKGYRLIITMPDNMTPERRKIMSAYGAEVILTPAADGMRGAIAKALEIQAANPGAFIPQQFENPANPEAHKNTTAVEIIRDTDGRFDVFVACVGTGGTISGIGEALKSKIANVEVVAVEPEASPLLSGGKAAPHKIPGIGANFVPANFRRESVDRIMTVSDEEAAETARLAARKEGLFVGVSSGAALAAALRLSNDAAYAGKRIIVLLPDSGERYLSEGK
ncbi:MAG: cysteine synthase A [Kiritimatiellaeota bacterium]|nr:cysteine synthase A [Kiritimatiellota bacterium]